MLSLVRQIDWCSPKGACFIAGLVFLLRLPLCLAGVGFDNDSYLYLVNAILNNVRGEMTLSRSPGYFIPDMIGYWLAPHGWLYLNLLSSAVQSLSIFAFAVVLRATELPHKSILLWLYALLPLNIVGYADVMIEYSLAVFGILVGWAMLVRGKVALAGVLWGIGAAMRPSQGVLILFVLLIIIWRFLGPRQMLSAATLATVPLLTLWIIPTYLITRNWKVLVSYLPYPFELDQWLIHVGMRLVAPLGLLTLVAAAYGMWKARPAIVRSVRGDLHYALSATAALILLLLFLRHPFKANYLLLAVPFGIYCLTRLAPNTLKAVALFAIANGIIAVPSSPPVSPHSIVGTGVVLADFRDRLLLRAETFRIVADAPHQSATFVGTHTLRFIYYECVWQNPSRYQVKFLRYRNDPTHIYDADRRAWFIAVIDANSLKEALRYYKGGFTVRVTDAIYRHFGSGIPEAIRLRIERLPTNRRI